MKQPKALYLWLFALFCFVGIIVMPQKVQAASPNFDPMGYQAKAQAAVVIDADSGQVLYAKDAKAVLPVASMSKMVGLYLVLKAIDQGKISWSDTVTPDEAQAALSQDTALSNVPLTAGTAYTVKELYDASWIYSANVAIMLLGQKVAGSQANFVTLMQQQLQIWGIQDAQIVNASGLNNNLLGTLMVPDTGTDAENKMSAYDVAQVAQHILADYPQVIETTKIAQQTFRPDQADAFEMVNWNMLLPGLQMHDTSLAIDGLKTGTSDAAGECFTGTLQKDGRRLISVVMHAQGADDDKTKRFTVTAELLKATFAFWQYGPIMQKNMSLPTPKKVKVINGQQAYVELVSAKAQKMWQPLTKMAITGHVALKTTFKKGVSAPVKAGVAVGQYRLDDAMFTYIDQQPKLTVATEKKVAKLPWYQIIFNKFF